MKLLWILFLFELIFVITKSQSQKIKIGNRRYIERQLCVRSATSATSLNEGDDCIDGNSSPGICMGIQKCTWIWDNLKRTNRILIEYVQKSICNNPKRLVCCPGSDEKSSDEIPLFPPIIESPDDESSENIQPEVESETHNIPHFERLTDATGANCKDGNGNPGTCMSVQKCKSPLNDLMKTGENQTIEQNENRSDCGTMEQLICCPDSTLKISDEIPVSIPTKQADCGFSNSSHTKVIGGQNAKQGSWPWMALLVYDEPDPFRCGGALITARHVLTAAHCLFPTLTHVRLGEHDLSTDTEAVHVDMEIDRYHGYPEYSSLGMRGDLGIVFLKENAPLDDHITPICLPSTPQLRKKSYLRHSPSIAGWGQTGDGSSSAILQELQISIIENKICAMRFAELDNCHTENQFDAAVICAAQLVGIGNSCRGDSGGPLMIHEKGENGAYSFYILGVISYGGDCNGTNIPSIYTSVQYFMDWIQKEIDTDA